MEKIFKKRVIITVLAVGLIMWMGLVPSLAQKPVTIKFAHFYDPAAGTAHVMNMDWLDAIVDIFITGKPAVYRSAQQRREVVLDVAPRPQVVKNGGHPIE